ncbi:N-acetylglucosamine-6-phosphate deacetylase [[Clostridium] innocuum]|uniref:N-acetylglucosamine-6-phosphate deacetylase n=1 Tax=Clostridium innocuum TaxID=1522 RepID=UPI0021482F12|nr:N-acetylglucosamine-6-phosphate deacetylase [[Clostridium] innocuum]MCR0274481.1 N-acetylglucosamine-6-phosphate deacetylase [[Clostridium] innocuum]
MKTMIRNARVLVHAQRCVKEEAVLIEDGTILDIASECELPHAEQVIDAEGLYLAPGLLDTHTHGIGGFDFNTCTAQAIEEIIALEHAEGVTGFLASLVVENHAMTMERLQLLDSQVTDSLLGIHLEGPFLNPKQKAVMKEEFLRLPDIEEFRQFLRVSSHVSSMTIAPELLDAQRLIKEGTRQGIVMNVGHSMADAQQVMQAQRNGAKGITHLYNAMSQHEHRNPGVVTGALLSDLMCELIVDGFHVHPDVVHATYRALGDDRIILISDANPYKAVADGEYPFSGKNIVIQDGKATVKETGRIAGSTLAMNTALRNMCRYTGCSVESAVRMAAYNPARLYGWKKGSIEPGYDADLMLMDDAFHIHRVWQRKYFM